MAKFQAAAAPKCPACSKSVYAAEEVKGMGRSWHALCFCCKACGKSLRGGQFREHDGWPYCEADHARLFGPKGIGFGSTLGDTGITAAPGASGVRASPVEPSPVEDAAPTAADAPVEAPRERGETAAAFSSPAEGDGGPAAPAPAAASSSSAPAPAGGTEGFGSLRERMAAFQKAAGAGAAAAPARPPPGGGAAARFGSAAPKCPACSKSVYAAEEEKALGRSWHKLCFCCKACGRSLRGGQYKEHDGWPYCEADYNKMFGPKGIGFGSTLGDTGITAAPDASGARASPVEPSPVEDAEPGPSPVEDAAPSSGAGDHPSPAGDAAPPSTDPEAVKPAPRTLAFGGGAPKCPACAKSVYAAEEIKALNRSWHALCFCCKACGKSLRGGQYREHDGWPYCEADHAKLFGPKGIGFGGTMGDTGVAAPVAAETLEADAALDRAAGGA